MNCFKTKKPVGLINSNTTCYMNSIIQAISASTCFIDYVEKLKKLNPNNSCISLVNDLIQKINAGSKFNNSKKKVTKILNELIKTIQWNKSSEQDAFDLLASLLKGMESDLTKDKMVDSNPFYVNLVYSFKGINISSRIQKNLGLSLNLCGKYHEPAGVHLKYLIAQHFVASIIDDDPNKTSKLTFLKTSPDLLLIHIQANKWDDRRGEMIKPKYFIEYEETMMVQFDVVKDSSENESINCKSEYELKAVVRHSGNISQGHYVTYRKYNKKWYFINDDKVKKIDFDNKICPYILIYEKR